MILVLARIAKPDNLGTVIETNPQPTGDNIISATIAVNDEIRDISDTSVDAGVLSRSDKATMAFREHIARLGGTFEHIPAGTFTESGTDVTTVLLAVNVP